MLIKCDVQRGFIDTERFAKIQTVNGVEQVAVSGSLVEDSGLRVAAVDRREGQYLVELPVESARGNWRVWVREDQVLERAS